MLELKCLLDEINACNDGHKMMLVKCPSEHIVKRITSNNTYAALLRAVNNSNLELLNMLLKTITDILGPIDCLKALTKRYIKHQNYTVLHTALDRGYLKKHHKCILDCLANWLAKCCEDPEKGSLKDSFNKDSEMEKHFMELVNERDTTTTRDLKSLSTEHKYTKITDSSYQL